jgi:hypothetical protein
MSVDRFQRLALTGLQQGHDPAWRGCQVFDHRAGSGAGAALETFGEHLSANLAHPSLESCINCPGRNFQWHIFLIDDLLRFIFFSGNI